jgi:manganese/zinc/iron transport system substrate-binding protein
MKMCKRRLGTCSIRWLSLVVVGLTLTMLAGCGAASGQDADDGKLHVVTTTGQIGDIVAHVGGEHVVVTALMGPGVDPHLFVASEGDVDRLQKADVIFYNGLFLEAQMADVLRQIGERKPSIAVADAIDPQGLLPWAQHSGEYDPHIWFDVSLWMKAVEAVRDGLAGADAANAATYQANADAYLTELKALDAYIKAQVERVPPDQRVLVTAHDAFHYFGRAYGFDVRGLQGISTASEASTADVRDLADFIAERKINVADRGFSVEIGGQLYSDALGSPDGDAGTYVGMVRHNIDTIVGALTAQP